tara:strand:- start:770 stop:1138 length:369 start_codon:yes stop_codon:yes gene_type:complete
MANIENFIDAMISKDHVQSNNIFAELMSQKVDAALDAEKVAMAGQIFNDVEEIDDEDISDEDLEAAADEVISDEDLEDVEITDLDDEIEMSDVEDLEDHEPQEDEATDISSEEELELEDETV